ncbi:DUF6802 family protein [Dietzia sp.]|uniref:DUF6802 family protein n=1 Tax=Dietzia sp. TaxID=1871616 RepID=UPI002FD9C9BF
MSDFPEFPGAGHHPGDGTHGPLTTPEGDPVVCGVDGLPAATENSLSFRMPLASEILDIGIPEADMDGDGFMEALTLQDERGLTVYSDADGDRAIDRVSTVRFDGTYDSWELSNAREHTAFGGFTSGAPTLEEDLPRWTCLDWGRI